MKKIVQMIFLACMISMLIQTTFAAELDESREEKQKYLERLVQSILAENDRMSKALLEYPIAAECLGFHVLDNYKVLLQPVSTDRTDNVAYEIQIRPESGIGYYFHVITDENAIGYGSGKGICENWNWNGDFDYSRIITEEKDITFITRQLIVGKMKNGYYNGQVKWKFSINEGTCSGVVTTVLIDCEYGAVKRIKKDDEEWIDEKIENQSDRFVVFGNIFSKKYLESEEGKEWLIWDDSTGIVNVVDTLDDATQGEESEYIYDVFDSGEDIILPTWRLEEVLDADCTVKSIDTLLEEVPLEKLQTPTGTDLATLYAETAIMRAACKKMDGGDLTINAALLKIAESVAVEAQGRLAEKLESVGIPPAREISKTVTLTTDETTLDIHIDPDVLQTQVDKIRVETPTYALTFKLADLQDDLTGVLQFQAEDTGAGFAPSRTTKKAGTKTVVKISLPKPKMSNPVTVSMPKQTGETVHQAVVSTDGQATASKYNPATDLMDGKVNSSGSYTVKSNEKDFCDIANKSQEMQKAIRYLASKGIINGTTETAFSPDGSINRAEIATLIVKALGKLDASAAASFTDVQRGSWYYPAAASSQKQGYIQGYEDRTFRGMTTISKVQIISVSSRVLQKEMRYKVPASPTSILTKYGDTVDAWAQSDVALAMKENLVLYRRDGTFSGRRNMTRGDAAIIIYRLFQKIW